MKIATMRRVFISHTSEFTTYPEKGSFVDAGQQAATGGDPTREYPCEGGWDGSRCNSDESRLNRTTAVGMYLQGATQQGVVDMAANVWEWCLNEQDNLEEPEAVRIDKGVGRRVLRGGSWDNGPGNLRVSLRSWVSTDYRTTYLGFRLVQDIP